MVEARRLQKAAGLLLEFVACVEGADSEVAYFERAGTHTELDLIVEAESDFGDIDVWVLTFDFGRAHVVNDASAEAVTRSLLGWLCVELIVGVPDVAGVVDVLSDGTVVVQHVKFGLQNKLDLEFLLVPA